MSSLKDSRQQERRGAALHGGTVNSGSGNGPWRKNDVRTPTTSIEYKVTSAKQYPLKLAELLAAERQALLDNGRSMLFGIQMGGRNWLVMSEEDYLTLVQEAG
ncbi:MULTISPECIES: hypothetical protein [Streptosporangium]|uniref:Prevent-host-death protein n=1 Tax=Streptosporangium brasiliense TaxID=47480 RepID=A0ABT9RQ62_9ACTN|nr:hypothetical protein [Streptosporangium brasiliense]MDP9870425.1 hypothetical protein [Streptosporangium brasiliense]